MSKRHGMYKTKVHTLCPISYRVLRENEMRILILCLLLSGCVYAPKHYDIEQLIECPIEGGGISQY